MTKHTLRGMCTQTHTNAQTEIQHQSGLISAHWNIKTGVMYIEMAFTWNSVDLFEHVLVPVLGLLCVLQDIWQDGQRLIGPHSLDALVKLVLP